jgi:hypothetical protein
MTDSERERLSRHRGRARVLVAVAASGLTILGGVAIGAALRSSAAGGVAAAAVAAAFGGYFAPCSFPILAGDLGAVPLSHPGGRPGSGAWSRGYPWLQQSTSLRPSAVHQIVPGLALAVVPYMAS